MTNPDSGCLVSHTFYIYGIWLYNTLKGKKLTKSKKLLSSGFSYRIYPRRFLCPAVFLWSKRIDASDQSPGIIPYQTKGPCSSRSAGFKLTGRPRFFFYLSPAWGTFQPIPRYTQPLRGWVYLSPPSTQLAALQGTACYPPA